MAQIIIDATDAIIGRMATFAAKQSLLGQDVIVVNCEKALFTKSRKSLVEKYQALSDNGTPFKGPFRSRLPDRFVRRVIRGMIPHHSGRGKEAFKRVMCYMGIPEEFKDKKTLAVDYAHKSHSHSTRFTTVYDVCKALGAHV